jgi:hypothetical protein
LHKYNNREINNCRYEYTMHKKFYKRCLTTPPLKLEVMEVSKTCCIINTSTVYSTLQTMLAKKFREYKNRQYDHVYEKLLTTYFNSLFTLIETILGKISSHRLVHGDFTLNNLGIISKPPSADHKKCEYIKYDKDTYVLVVTDFTFACQIPKMRRMKISIEYEVLSLYRSLIQLLDSIYDDDEYDLKSNILGIFESVFAHVFNTWEFDYTVQQMYDLSSSKIAGLTKLQFIRKYHNHIYTILRNDYINNIYTPLMNLYIDKHADKENKKESSSSDEETFIDKCSFM